MSQHAYKNLTSDQYEEHFSNFLINTWSYSKLSTFARNEKSFEMQYLYGVRTRSSASTVAGRAYHEGLKFFFNQKKKGIEADIVDIEKVAFDYIEDEEKCPANMWKIQKTTPTVEECKIKATKNTTSLIGNFFKEPEVYNLKEIIEVEIKISEFLTINGVDIPLPCTSIIDIVAITNDDKLVIIDHKSKAKVSDEKEIALTAGKQAITYVKNYEEMSGNTVDEVWFIENKISQNRDKSPQLTKFEFEMNKHTRGLYECLLYEPLKRMIEAVNNPDYVYLINEADNYVDLAELFEFWTQTQIAEIDEFPNIDDDKKEVLEKRQKKIRNSNAGIDPGIIKTFQKSTSEFIQYNLSNKNMKRSEKVEHVLRTFGIITNVAHTFEGYSSDTYLIEVTAGVRIAQIMKYKLDIANALNVSNIRIQSDLYVYEGKSYVAAESQKKREKDLLFDLSYLNGMKLPIGINNFNEPVIWDLENPSTPHALVCGGTGSGKSVSIMSTVEFAIASGVEEVIFLDPKFEFLDYKEKGFEVINDIREIEERLDKMVGEMNKRVASGIEKKTLLIFDEFADAFASARKGKDLKLYENVEIGVYAKLDENGNQLKKYRRECVGELKPLEENLRMLLQKGRSAGYRILAATQRASAKIITGDAKVNFPVQICFKVQKEIDSKVVLDEGGAETLSGKGDGLINSPEYNGLVRFQAFWKK